MLKHFALVDWYKLLRSAVITINGVREFSHSIACISFEFSWYSLNWNFIALPINYSVTNSMFEIACCGNGAFEFQIFTNT